MRELWRHIAGLGIPLDMLLSAVIAVGWTIVLMVSTGFVTDTLYGAALLLIPLAIIWLREPLSGITGNFGFHRITTDTPPEMVGVFGWLVLIGLIVMTGREVFGQ